MPQKKSIDAIGVAARLLMARGFAEGWSAARIAQAILDQTGEKLAERTVARRAAVWREETGRRKLARERMEDLVGALRKGDTDASEMIQALAMDRLVDNPEALTSADPIAVQGLSLKAEELRLKKRQIEVRERAVAIDEKKMTMLEAREQRAIATVLDDREQLTDEQRVERIREIYGLSATTAA
jgi:hypothetical protein